MIVVADSGSLIAFAMLGQLDVLHQLYGQVPIPQEVWVEVVIQGDGEAGSNEVRAAGWIEVVGNSPSVLFTALREQLDPGEAAALALASERCADLVLVDDRRGRAMAPRLGLRVRGTLGVLVEAKRSGLVPAVMPLVARLLDQGFRASSEVVAEIAELTGEVG